ncbi:curli assembly protein CsgF [Limimaricola cinnabarinus]|uniref:curli assembly protein CsgF n=1 Tax=Limimaricola cinnabarinus TaxID=1125964 RepID=UPI002493AC96|nr:curli assembly protein CsgF [Limimaricola cinnabarinus]
MKMQKSVALALCAFLGLPVVAAAQGLVYSPLNPGLGGNPDLFGPLNELANIQNEFAEDGGGGGGFPIIEFPDIDIDLGGGIGGADDVDPADGS